MARSRSRSPRGADGDSRRSPSPHPRHHDTDRERRPKKSSGGFRWKEKRRPEESEHRDERRGLERGYRERARSPERERRRERSRSGDRYRRNDRYSRDDAYDRRRRDDYRDGRDDRDSRRDEKKEEKKERKEKKEKKPAAPSEPMMVVNVNDRLGTKAAIPCFASDTIRDFKRIVAAQIGREPHEILLKRQGERPFKDILTLADYGVSNGVQLDLEVDTGD
ncbi:hypothetical protein AAP_01772 [Ascosphaera apis ARSEF 7405]|uniref:Ubiquitin-like modifier HUB1 n=1 Tax=Ascosphaera apis ARSEF 7405 TaxID=392613 RepID=A0A162IHX7_9EURO|nr:hypothetical protein AAP_01772 [Ascosphaera apis ARSEF 7405]